MARRSAATDGYSPAIRSTSPTSTSAGTTPGHSVLAPRNHRRRPMSRAVWKVPPGIGNCDRWPPAMSGPSAARSDRPPPLTLTFFPEHSILRLAASEKRQDFLGLV